MTINTKTDLIMRITYDTEGMVYVIETFKNMGLYLNEVELKSILNNTKGYIVHQRSHRGIRTSLTPNGEDFVQNDSFSVPGIPIIDLDFDLPCS